MSLFVRRPPQAVSMTHFGDKSAPRPNLRGLPQYLDPEQ